MSSLDEADLQVVGNRLRASATFSGCLEWKALNGSRDPLTQLLRPLKMVLIGRISLRRNNLPWKTAYRHTVWDKLKSAHLLSLGEQLVQLHVPPGAVPFAQITCPVCLTPNLNLQRFQTSWWHFSFCLAVERDVSDHTQVSLYTKMLSSVWYLKRKSEKSQRPRSFDCSHSSF